MTFVSYAQNFEDVLLWRALGMVPDGFYIDVGASHPDDDSVTRAFYDRGWRGINVEPTETSFRRLVAARPRDVNLRLAIAAAAGTATFFGMDETYTGLSTLDAEAVEHYATLGIAAQRTEVRTETLAEVCRAHAAPEIHFLKVDVEGAERMVLQSADFAAYRPWIVLVEATAPMSTVETHAGWEPILLDAGYRFAWFDGLNRFYIAAEHHAELEPFFRTPPNVFDGFVRAADSDWARRVAAAETRADADARLIGRLEQRAAVAEDRSEAAHLRLARADAAAARAGSQAARRLEALEADLAGLRLQAADGAAALQAARDDLRSWQARTAELEGEHHLVQSWLDAMRRSTSWRITAPLRRLLALARTEAATPPPPHAADPPPRPPEQAAAAAAGLPPAAAPPARSRPRTVHQVHTTAAAGTPVTASMLLTRRILRDMGYTSRIFAEQVDPALNGEAHPLDDMPETDGCVLLVHHSAPYTALGRVLALPGRKILVHHAAAPAPGGPPDAAREAETRRQLLELRSAADAALADSEVDALVLRQLGFTEVAACSLAMDVEAMAAPPRLDPPSPRFTILFVGPVTGTAGQLDLVAAFQRFSGRFAAASRLVLVGSHLPGPDLQALLELVAHHGLGEGAVEIAGPLTGDALRARYAEAELYVSLSRADGPDAGMAEAVASGVPVLALDSGAASALLRDPATAAGDAADAGLLPDAVPATVAAAMLAMAENGTARRGLAARQSAALRRLRLPNQLPALETALARAGVASPVAPAARVALSASASFTVAGHLNGAGERSGITRSLALALQEARPGAVRLLPVEGDVPTAVHGLPEQGREQVGGLIARPAPAGRPHVVISHHHPVWTPPEPGDVALALVTSGDTAGSALVAPFRGVLVPTRRAAAALLESGILLPVRVLDLSAAPKRVADTVAGFAAELLLEPDPPPLSLAWIAGPGDAEDMHRLAAAAGLPGSVLIGDPATELPALVSALLRADPRAVVVRPGRSEPAGLPALLRHPALHGRIVCLLLDGVPDLPDAAAVLRGASRIVVHEAGDLARLAALGLDDIAVLIPGTAGRQAGQRWRDLLGALSASFR